MGANPTSGPTRMVAAVSLKGHEPKNSVTRCVHRFPKCSMSKNTVLRGET